MIYHWFLETWPDIKIILNNMKTFFSRIFYSVTFDDFVLFGKFSTSFLKTCWSKKCLQWLFETFFISKKISMLLVDVNSLILTTIMELEYLNYWSNYCKFLSVWLLKDTLLLFWLSVELFWCTTFVLIAQENKKRWAKLYVITYQ